jgi:hypothetical protein
LIVENARFRASCWLRQPFNIAANNCSAGRSSATPLANDNPADPGTPSR